MNPTQNETLVDAMKASFAATLRAPDGVEAPVALLWTDADRQWKAFATRAAKNAAPIVSAWILRTE